MSSPGSRYRRQPSELIDRGGGLFVQSQELRTTKPLAEASIHVVSASDRLDNLADRYYSQPTGWWFVCDGNPEVLSPFELLGKSPVSTAMIPVNGVQEQTWNALRHALRALNGVEDVRIEETWRNYESVQAVGESTVTVVSETVDRVLIVTFNELVTAMTEILVAIDGSGSEAGSPQRIERIGKPIRIPNSDS